MSALRARKPGWQRVAERLADGRWHSSFELACECCVLSHSRISELRDKGYVIETRRVSGAEGLHAFEYRQTSTPEAESGNGTLGRVAPASLSASGAGEATGADGATPAELPAPVFIEGQLSVFDALGAAA